MSYITIGLVHDVLTVVYCEQEDEVWPEQMPDDSSFRLLSRIILQQEK